VVQRPQQFPADILGQARPLLSQFNSGSSEWRIENEITVCAIAACRIRQKQALEKTTASSAYTFL